MGSAEEVSLRVGEGRISGSISIFLGVSCFLGVLCFHFPEILFTRSTVLLPIYLLGFAENAINAYVVWVGIQGVLIHSNTSIPFGPLAYLFATPHFHHWHHAADSEAIDKNYAANLPVLDMIFGTYIGNRGRWPERYGVVGKPLPTGFLAQHLYPFIARPKGETGP
jgi:sterol desaturase/sphingolipid hydroxylase (fatty acid hydroxylase superfamily)